MRPRRHFLILSCFQLIKVLITIAQHYKQRVWLEVRAVLIIKHSLSHFDEEFFNLCLVLWNCSSKYQRYILSLLHMLEVSEINLTMFFRLFKFIKFRLLCSWTNRNMAHCQLCRQVQNLTNCTDYKVNWRTFS